MKLEKIISGGQTGVDRAALDFAIEHGIPHGGWVPLGRQAEDGYVPDKYQVQEHFASGYPPRTQANVRNSDATAIFLVGPINEESGCLLTLKFCREMGRSVVVANLKHGLEACVKALRLLPWTNVKILNVAGARGSLNPDVDLVKRVLFEVLFEKGESL